MEGEEEGELACVPSTPALGATQTREAACIAMHLLHQSHPVSLSSLPWGLQPYSSSTAFCSCTLAHACACTDEDEESEEEGEDAAVLDGEHADQGEGESGSDSDEVVFLLKPLLPMDYLSVKRTNLCLTDPSHILASA